LATGHEDVFSADRLCNVTEIYSCQGSFVNVYVDLYLAIKGTYDIHSADFRYAFKTILHQLCISFQRLQIVVA
jgi:hypothetical protein